MRITQGVLINNMMRDYNRNMSRMERLNMQLSSGRRINRPSDDPAGLVTSLRLRTSLHHNEQYKKNTGDALSWIEKADSVFNSLNEVLQRARVQTLYGANSTNDQSALNALADELEQLRAEVEELANSTLDDRYIFGGTNTTSKIYDGGTWIGNNLPIEYEIGQASVMQVNFDGTAFGIDYSSGTADASNSVFATLDNIINDLRSGNTANLSGVHIESLDKHIDQLLSCRAQAGAKMNRLELVSSRQKDLDYNYTKLLSDNEEIDVAEIIIRLTNQENVYRASLAVGARLIQPSLVDFLR